MNKTFLIFKQEFLKTIRRTGFIILTLALPVVGILAIGILNIVSGIAQPPVEVIKVGYVDEAGGFNQFLTQGNVTLVGYNSQEAAKQALISKDITEYMIIPQNFISSGTVNLYTIQKELAPSSAVSIAIQNFISSNLLTGKVPADVIARIESGLNPVSTTLTSTGEVAPEQVGYQNFIVPGIFSFLLALSLIFTATYVLQSLAEEKENRLMEILLSSVSTRQLLTGKVLGLGAAGLVQVIVWVISLPLLLNLASSSIGGFIATIHVPATFWVLGVVYFILGYSLFAVLSASIASVTSSVQEAQGVAGIYTIFSIAPFWFISLLLLYPNSPVWVVFSFFPFTAPVLVLMRLGLFGVPTWQLAVSMALLVVFIVGGLLLASRLLRAYMLLYGKRPSLGKIIRNLRSG